ncbi:integration host factor subunit alpha [Gammaproteobacteria bacterium]
MREGNELIALFFDELKKALESGEQFKLSGFGNFNLLEKEPRPGRNPKTGEEIPISPRRVVTFHASHMLKARVAGYNLG